MGPENFNVSKFQQPLIIKLGLESQEGALQRKSARHQMQVDSNIHRQSIGE